MWKKVSKKLKGWKTFLINTFSIWLSAILWILPDAITFLNTGVAIPLVPAEFAPWVVVGLGIANLIVRKFTDSPPGAWAGKPKEDTNVLPR